MTSQDAELDQFRNGISCATLLERLSPGWRLDRKESSRRSLKYRRGKGEIVIINHDGRGWWDPQGSAKGDVFDLVRFLDPALSFGQACQILRPFVGMTPAFTKGLGPIAGDEPVRCLAQRWATRQRLRMGSPVWRYLADTRCLPASVLLAAADNDAVREGPYGSAWFAHRDEAGTVSHIEIRGPDFKGSVRGGSKTLFALSGAQPAIGLRIVLAEAPIDALSVAALEGIRADTAYLATGGGMGPGTVAAIGRTLMGVSPASAGLLVCATDADLAGDRFAACHAEMAKAAGVPFARMRPTTGLDWNDMLRLGRGI